MEVILYTRNSSERGNKDGRSPKEQEDVLREECEERGWNVAAVCKDVGISASKYSLKERPGFLELQRRIADDEADIVGVYEFSRLTRKGPGSEWEEMSALLRKHKVLLFDAAVGATYDMDNPEDEYRAENQASTSKLESARISRRVRRNTKARAKTGAVHSKLGFGWRKEFDADGSSRWVIDPVAAEAIRDAYPGVIAGTTSLRSIAAKWNAAKISTSRGNEWNIGKVKLALTRPTVAGIRIYKGEALTVPGEWEPIVSREQYAELVAVLSDPARLRHRGVKANHLLSGIATCSVCGKPLQFAGTGRYNPAYRCMNGHVNRSEPDLDRHVERKLFVAIHQYAADLFVMSAEDDESEVSDDSPVAEALNLVATLEERLTQTRILFSQGTIPFDEYAAMQTLLRPQIDAAKRQAEQAAPNRVLYDFASAVALDAEGLPTGDAPRIWETADLETRRKFVRAAVEVVVCPIPDRAGRNARVFDPEFVKVQFLGYGSPVEITDEYVRDMTERLRRNT